MGQIATCDIAVRSDLKMCPAGCRTRRKQLAASVLPEILCRREEWERGRFVFLRAPVRKASFAPVAPASAAAPCWCCSAREFGVGAMVACNPASIARSIRANRHHGFPGADVALQQPVHRAGSKQDRAAIPR